MSQFESVSKPYPPKKIFLDAVDAQLEQVRRRNMRNSLRFPPSKTVYMRFAKLIGELQHPEKGIFANNAALEIDTAPCENCRGGSSNLFHLRSLFTWLQENKGFDDKSETANFLMRMIQLGYIYPCSFESRNSVRKCEDYDRTLYGFQAINYWPASSIPPDDFDYAIYLHSRSKGGILPPLSDSEQLMFEKLRRKHYASWSFVEKMTQKEAELWSLCCDHDRKIHQWQEFAYWKVSRARFISDFSSEGLRRFNEKPWIKEENEVGTTKEKKSERIITKCCSRIVKLTEDWNVFDPMLSDNPSPNPWTLESVGWPKKEAEDIPTVFETKRWGVSFELLMHDEQGMLLFEDHLKQEFSVENLDFYRDCLKLKLAPEKSVVNLVRIIFETYLAVNAKQPINIDTRTKTTVRGELKRNPSRYTFDVALDHIYNLMKNDSYRRFLRSSIYKQAVAIATDPIPPPVKRGVFVQRVKNLAAIFSFTAMRSNKH